MVIFLSFTPIPFKDPSAYLWRRPHILALTLVKGAGALSYGAIDVVQVNFAETIFRIGNNGSGTLGLIYAAIGIGTGIGLLQMTVPNRYRGRVFAFDMAVYTLAAALSTMWAGFAFDNLGLSAREVAFVSGVVAVSVLSVWGIYQRMYLKTVDGGGRNMPG